MMTMETKAMAATCLCLGRRRCQRRALAKLPPHSLSWPPPHCCHATNATPNTLTTTTAKTFITPALVNVTILNHQLNLIFNNSSFII